MSVLKLVLGFVVGIIACAILLGLISIRSPILADSETLATQKVAEVAISVNENGEQKVNTAPTEASNVENETQLTNENAAELLDTNQSTETETDINAQDVQIESPPQDIVVDSIESQPEAQPETPRPVVVEPVPAKVLKRAGNILELGSGSSRLPSVSDTTEGTVAVQEAPIDSVTTFIANSNPLVELDTPFLSIILVDIGTAGVSQAELLKQTLPLTFAVDGSRTDAKRVAGDYRAAGFEIIALMNDDQVAELTTADAAIEVVQGYFHAVPDALAIVDAPSARLQKNRRILSPVLASLTGDAPGFLTYKGGLGTAAKETQEAGLPTGVITRYLDETYGSPSIIKRAIDRTTIEAAKNGAAILMAVATPSVLQGIAQWADSTAAAKVELVPVSSAMTRQKQ